MRSCDVFYISYDEPNSDQNWHYIKNLVPEAQRIHGIKGFDAAYRTCAVNSKSQRFFTIDGDSELSPAFLDLNGDVKSFPADAILSWAARNSVNGLAYGNGGVKNWPRTTVLKMKTHEASETNAGAVEFCFLLNYILMPETLSVAKINCTPMQAFRAGFREGVKLCLERGNKPQGEPNDRALLRSHVARENLDRLRIWCSVGADVENGLWSIYGARLGIWMTLGENWTFHLIRDYDWMRKFWEEKVWPERRNLEQRIGALEEKLNHLYELGIVTFGADESVFFKSVYINPLRNGPMFKQS